MLNDVREVVSAAAADSAYRTCSVLFNAVVADVRRAPQPGAVAQAPLVAPAGAAGRARASPGRQMLLHLRGWQRDTALLQLALGAGFGEVAGLTPHGVDLVHRRVTIRRRFYNGTVRATKNHPCATAGVPRVSSHGLRHTSVSWMIDDGHSADEVACWIGDTPATVRAVYAHMLEASSAPAAASIDVALDGLG